LGADYIETVNKYKYLGVLFSEKRWFCGALWQSRKSWGSSFGCSDIQSSQSKEHRI
jgi:hypothetical protein